MIRYALFTTPFGTGAVSQTDAGILEVIFPKAIPGEARRLLKGGTPKEFVEVPDLSAAKQLEEYFAGKRTRFDAALDLSRLTIFQREVLEACARIPYGETSSYGELAREVGRPSAPRAVGQVMARNPIPIIIPCHRVLASDGTLHGFGGGLELKQRLLDFEAANIQNK